MVWPGWQEPPENAYFDQDFTDSGVQNAVFSASGGLWLTHTIFFKERLSLSAAGENFSKKDYHLAPRAKILKERLQLSSALRPPLNNEKT